MTRSPAKLPNLTPVDRGTVQEQVYRKLRDALMKGHFGPGDPVTIRALAKALGTSEMPVREALRQLVAEHALVAQPNRTITVPTLSAERVHEVREIRVALEGMLAERAADRISKADVKKLAALHDEMGRMIAGGDIKRYLALNQEFHFLIYASAGLPTALRVVENMWLQVGPVFNFLLGQDVPPQSADPKKNVARFLEENHLDAVKALRKKDGKAVRRAITNDINDAADYLLSLRHFDQ